jgi:spore coat polysaccharide biosynthesis protein SpsF (cytidylyltransferase family)
LNNSGRFRIGKLYCPYELPNIKLSVDTSPDLEFIRTIYSKLGEEFGLSEILELYK